MDCELFFARYSDILICFATGGNLPEPTFQRWLQEIREAKVRRHLCAVVNNIGFTTKMRREAAEFSKDLGLRNAIVNEDRIGRGIVTAMSWFGADIKAFDWDAISAAAAFLGVTTPAGQIEVTNVVWNLRREASQIRFRRMP